MSAPPASTPMDALASMMIDDKYALLARVGRGATGEVYKARDVQSNEIVAVKLVDLEDAEDDVADIQREITLLAQCSSPYVTRYMSSTLVPGTSKLAIVMEYMAGGSARHALNEIETTSTNEDEHSSGVKGKGVSEGEIAYIMRDVLRALEYLHHEGKIHRDIKAANVLLTEKAEARLADFGVSGQMTHTLGARRKTFTGTPFWMAPEVIQGSEGYDEKADIWSLGITCYELATGAAPHAELHPMRVLFVIPKSDAPRLPQEGSFSVEFQDFVAKCLQKTAKDRPSAKELLQHDFLKRVDPEAIAALKARVDKHVALTEKDVIDGQTNNPGASGRQVAKAATPSWDFGDDSLGRKFASKVQVSVDARADAVDEKSENGGSTVYQSMGGTIRMAIPPNMQTTDDESEELGDSMGAATVGTTSSHGGGVNKDRFRLDEVLDQTFLQTPLMRSLIVPAMTESCKSDDPEVSSAYDKTIESLDALEMVAPGSLSLFIQSIMRRVATSRDESLSALKGSANALFGGANEETFVKGDGGRSVLANYLLRRWQADVEKARNNK